MKKYNYYVVQVRRANDSRNYVYTYNFDEAVEKKWVDSYGNRIWYELESNSNNISINTSDTYTFVYGFDNLEEAERFSVNLSSPII